RLRPGVTAPRRPAHDRGGHDGGTNVLDRQHGSPRPNGPAARPGAPRAARPPVLSAEPSARADKPPVAPRNPYARRRCDAANPSRRWSEFQGGGAGWAWAARAATEGGPYGGGGAALRGRPRYRVPAAPRTRHPPAWAVPGD